jgi:enamine deaminase RidA (YjgF/YER057c/UK114 family)
MRAAQGWLICGPSIIEVAFYAAGSGSWDNSDHGWLMAKTEAVYQEMGKWLEGVFPCSTGLVVPALARPEWVVEIEVTAVIPD